MIGIKFDKGKTRWDLLPFEIIKEVVEIITDGAKKYNDNNWQNLESNRIFAALMRHIVAWRGGEKFDKESKKHHLAHAICNLIFLIWLDKNKKY